MVWTKSSDNSLREQRTKLWNCSYVSTFPKNSSTLIPLHVDRRPVGRPRRRWADNIKMDLQEVGGGGMDMIWS